MGPIRDLYMRSRVLIHEIAKFGIVGALAFVITVVGADVLHTGLKLEPLLSAAIATIVATIFAFVGNKYWAFRHRQGNGLGRSSVLFFVFNGVGLLIQLAFIAVFHYGLGLTSPFWYNVSNISGIIVATVFRLYTYRRWVFPFGDAGPAAAQELQRETSGT